MSPTHPSAWAAEKINYQPNKTQADFIMSDFPPIVLNFIYVIIGGLLTLLFMKLSCTMFNKMVDFSISDELGKGNIAVGLMVMGIFIGLGISLGLVIGLGLS